MERICRCSKRENFLHMFVLEALLSAHDKHATEWQCFLFQSPESNRLFSKEN